MMNTIKKNLVYLCDAVLGAFTFVLFAFPYIAGFTDGVVIKTSETINGYKVMDLWDAEAWGVLSSLFQVLVLVAGVIIFAYGVCGLLKAFGIFKAFPDALGKLETKKLGEYLLAAYAVLNVLLVIMLVIFCIVNTEEVYSAKVGFRVSGGIFVAPILSVGAFVAYKLLDKKFA